MKAAPHVASGAWPTAAFWSAWISPDPKPDLAGGRGDATYGTAMRTLPICCAACLVHTERALGDIEPAVPARHWATRALVTGVRRHEPPR